MATENIGGNFFDKYGSRNPLVRRIMAGFLQSFDELYAQTEGASVLECGVGEGHLLARCARPGLQLRGFDLDSAIVQVASENLHSRGVSAQIRQGDLLQDDFSDWRSDVVICCEVLEHIGDPAMALERLQSLASGWLILSVPREPLWRMMNLARLRYISALGNTPGHVNHWSQSEIVETVRRYFKIVETRAPIPWTMMLCRPRQEGES